MEIKNNESNYTKYELEKIVEKLNSSEQIMIFGAGSFGQYFGSKFLSKNINIAYYIDNDESKEGKFINGIPIILANELKNSDLSNNLIFICSTWSEEISKQLLSFEIENFVILDFQLYFLLEYTIQQQAIAFQTFYESHKHDFEQLNFLWGDQSSREVFSGIIKYRLTGDPSYILKSQYPQYLHPIVSPRKNDVIFDGGAYIGDTAEIFLEYLENQCRIYSFEPSESNYKMLNNFIVESQTKNIIAVKAGLGEKNEKLYMNSTACVINSGYSIGNTGREETQVLSIDSYITMNAINNVNLIKLDVEGFELATLKGAMKTISTFKPRLQVCLYHKNEDLLDIPNYIAENFGNLGYKFYVGHHSDCFLETVLYASCE
ncbi:FkbM family methyltransferase [Lysinibacillus sp. NPDC093190]|uniref:FkbM family methyltransferase n=1 Tax=Lysinibacillus sp. NPDC093190 TaxID=3390575 RepID=UPI003D043363